MGFSIVTVFTVTLTLAGFFAFWLSGSSPCGHVMTENGYWLFFGIFAWFCVYYICTCSVFLAWGCTGCRGFYCPCGHLVVAAVKAILAFAAPNHWYVAGFGVVTVAVGAGSGFLAFCGMRCRYFS